MTEIKILKVFQSHNVGRYRVEFVVREIQTFQGLAPKFVTLTSELFQNVVRDVQFLLHGMVEQ